MRKVRKKNRGGLAPCKYLNRDQRKVLLDYCSQLRKKGGYRNITNAMIIYVLIYTGLRASELSALRVRALPLWHNKLIIDVEEGKGAIQRSVEIGSKAAAVINSYVRRHRKSAKPNSFLFVNEKKQGQLSYRSIYSRILLIGKKAGLNRLTPHMLRHSYAVALQNQCKDLRFVQDQLGHADPRVTSVYARTEDDLRRQFAEDYQP